LLLNKCFLISSRPVIELGFLFISLSIAIKLATSPFHLWALEIYERSTSIITFFFILLGKLSYFVILYRVYYFCLNNHNLLTDLFIVFISLASIIMGSFSNLKQKQVKTLLVYSSVTHVGYILLAFNIRSLFSVEVAYFYLLNYLLSNVVIWFIILLLIKRQVNYRSKFSKSITDFLLLNKTNKIATVGLLITLFSISGLPPFIGFFSKFGILLVLVSENLITIILIVILSTILSVFYYIRLIKVLYFENVKVGKLYYPLHSFNCFIFSSYSFMLSFLFINPKLLYLLIHRLVLNLKL
jgi:NADH-quinone oxidoreductase subunit N